MSTADKLRELARRIVEISFRHDVTLSEQARQFLWWTNHRFELAADLDA